MATHNPRRRRRQYREVEGSVLSQARLGFSAIEIREQLLSRLGAAETPSLRTIQRIVRGVSPSEDDSEPWTVSGSSDEEARTALAALVELGPYMASIHGSLLREKGRPVGLLNQRQVYWLTKIRQVVPGVPFPVAWRYMSEYIDRERQEEDTDDLDYGLAWAPSRLETTEEFFGRFVGHAKAHCDVWPDRPFIVTSFIPLTGRVAAQVSAVLAFLPGQYVSWEPHFDGSDGLFHIEVALAKRELGEIAEHWERRREEAGPRWISGPETKWGAIDEYVARVLTIEESDGCQNAATSIDG